MLSGVYILAHFDAVLKGGESISLAQLSKSSANA